MFRNPLASHRRAALLLAFCALCWSIAGVVTRHLERADSFEVTFWRSLFCAITVLSILAWQRRGNALAPVLEMGWPGLFSGAMWAVMFTCFMLALTRTSVANTLLVMSVAPLLAALLGRLVLGTRVSTPTWLAIAMAGAGIGWMVHDGVSADGLAGMAIALAVPLASAINIVVLKRVHADIDLAPAVLIGALLSCLATIALAWPFEASLRDLALLALLGAIQLAVPCFLMIRAVRHLAPHEVALITLLEVVLGPIWAWLGAGEAMPMATVQGGLIVLAALIGDTLLNRRAPPIAATAIGPAGLH
jgi:drug/metabolite transporter (DMT)-like permease